jgi:hypothetical protein
MHARRNMHAMSCMFDIACMFLADWARFQETRHVATASSFDLAAIYGRVVELESTRRSYSLLDRQPVKQHLAFAFTSTSYITAFRENHILVNCVRFS